MNIGTTRRIDDTIMSAGDAAQTVDRSFAAEPRREHLGEEVRHGDDEGHASPCGLDGKKVLIRRPR